MKQVGKIVIKKDSDLWKQLQKEKETKQTVEQVAAAAAERARKEVLDRAAKRDAERKIYLDSIRDADQLEFKNERLRVKIQMYARKYDELQAESAASWRKQQEVQKELQEKCSHDMVLERRTTYTDEYDQWHDGNYERKCIECFLVEESTYHPSERYYGQNSAMKKFSKLEKSQVILLRKTVDGKEFELEFDDLKW